MSGLAPRPLFLDRFQPVTVQPETLGVNSYHRYGLFEDTQSYAGHVGYSKRVFLHFYRFQRPEDPGCSVWLNTKSMLGGRVVPNLLWPYAREDERCNTGAWLALPIFPGGKPLKAEPSYEWKYRQKICTDFLETMTALAHKGICVPNLDGDGVIVYMYDRASEGTLIGLVRRGRVARIQVDPHKYDPTPVDVVPDLDHQRPRSMF